MDALERAQLIKDTFIQESINNGFTEGQAKGFFDIIIEYIEKLKNVRLNEIQTNKILDELINLSDTWESSMEESYFFTATKFSHIMTWIYKLILDDKTYWYAKLRIAQHNYQKIRMNPDKIQERYVSQKELEELILNELPKPLFRVKDDEYMITIHSQINEEIINCSSEQFIADIEAANFKLLAIKSDNKIKEVTYRLQVEMGEKWYSEVCKNMGWKKTNVSGRNVVFNNDLDKLLPRQKKK